MSRLSCRRPRASAPRGNASSCLRFTLQLVLAAALALALAPAAEARAQVFRVSGDPGGSVETRIALVEQLRASRTRVEIVGGCWSACTMFLSLPDACVSRSAQLGFHGPSSETYGIGLTPERFDYYSRLMAAYYPEPLRSWFLTEGRHITVGFTRFRGAELIGMGIRECR